MSLAFRSQQGIQALRLIVCKEAAFRKGFTTGTAGLVPARIDDRIASGTATFSGYYTHPDKHFWMSERVGEVLPAFKLVLQPSDFKFCSTHIVSCIQERRWSAEVALHLRHEFGMSFGRFNHVNSGES